MNDRQLKEIVKEKYGEAASRAARGGASCCGSSGSSERDPITVGLYDDAQVAGIPEKALLASLGCGNPTALAELKRGEVVLDLGSGGGIDVLLSARRVGPNGKAYGLDMTDEMLALARENQKKAGVQNVEFLKGEIENIPLPDNSVDVIISNCVINLAADKDRVLREAHRVLKPGGRLAVSDIVVRGDVPAEIRRNVELWIGCVAGALEESEYRARLVSAGFDAVDVEPTRVYRAEDAREFLACAGLNAEKIAAEVDGKFFSAFIRATRPAKSVQKEGSTRMTKLAVFDPPMCCSTGVCGPEVDPVLVRFTSDFHWLAGEGVAVERYNLAQQPQAFATNEVVKAALAADGNECLPLILVNGRVASKGRYPTREELARLTGLESNLTPSIFSDGIRELVAIGAAIASNCEPCFKYHFDKARKLGVSLDDMRSAVETARAVKDTPARSILELADKFLKQSPSASLPVVPASCCAPAPAPSGGTSKGCC
ncbi:MAG: arsenite efflux transporter metallochaperone ArsD [Acidobacteriia bacterium]|nr:arsenite efflux transporter metallochaperone ArsD [Terriglobia bacterium]